MRELSLHILDLAQNSIAAGANLIRITVEARTVDNMLRICISDNGRGMTQDILSKVRDPFYTTRTTRRVGMGIPMFQQAAEACDGWLRMDSEPNAGTSVEAGFKLDHIDRLPLGDMTATLVTLIASNPQIDFEYVQRVDKEAFALDTVELRETLQGVPLNEPEVLKWIRQYITDNVGGSLRID